jgi:hypothetical protein
VVITEVLRMKKMKRDTCFYKEKDKLSRILSQTETLKETLADLQRRERSEKPLTVKTQKTNKDLNIKKCRMRD